MANMEPYVIRQGDSLSTLSARYGFDPDEVWNDPANEDLRQRRPDPDVLAPCDLLYIPARKVVSFPLKTGTTNTFVSPIETFYGSLQLVDNEGNPVANQNYVIDSLDPGLQGATRPDGTIDLELPAGVNSARISFPDAGYDLVVQVAYLDPASEPSGVSQRLALLDLAEPGPTVVDPDTRQLVAQEYRAAATADFQQANGLTVTGELDDATCQAFVTAHGA